MWGDLLAGDPIEKWAEIMRHANEGSTKKELLRLLRLLAAYEIIVEEAQIPDIDAKLKRYTKTIDEEAIAKIKNHKNNIAIESMAKVLRENDG